MPQSPTVEVPKRWPLAAEPQNRSTSPLQDSRLVNCFVEKNDQGEFEIFKRPGLVLAANFSPNNIGYGVFHSSGYNYVVCGTGAPSGVLLKSGSAISYPIAVNNSVYRFNEVFDETDSGYGTSVDPYVWLDNGTGNAFLTTGAYVVNANFNTVANVVDSNFPAIGALVGRVKGSAYLDGTLYVGAGNQVFGSNIDTPTAWSALNVLIAQSFADRIVFVSKQLTYVVVLKQWSTEIFYDADNATGSPLAGVQSANLNIGCFNQNTVQEIEDKIIWVSASKVTGPKVYVLQNLIPTPVSTPPIERLLRNWSNADTTGFVIYTTVWKCDGHTFYILTNATANLTLVYDLDQGVWSQWTYNGGCWPMISSCYDETNNYHVMQHASNGNCYYMSLDYYSDAGLPIVVDIITPNFDAGVRRKKFLKQIEFVCDQVQGAIQHRYTDNDYQSWSEFEQTPLGATDGNFTTDQGSFRRRAYNFRYVGNTPFRLQSAEIMLDLGTL